MIEKKLMEQSTFDVALIHGSCCAGDLDRCLPPGLRLTQARRRHLQESEWLVASRADHSEGFAAYKRADGQIRVVHELLLDPALGHRQAVMVTDTLLSALELVALEDGVTCLTFFFHSTVVLEPFETRGYMSLALDRVAFWIQKKLGRPKWGGVCSRQQ